MQTAQYIPETMYTIPFFVVFLGLSRSILTDKQPEDYIGPNASMLHILLLK